jgi:hypothetical protein
MSNPRGCSNFCGRDRGSGLHYELATKTPGDDCLLFIVVRALSGLSFHRRRFASLRAHTHSRRERISNIHQHLRECGARAREQERESEVLNAKQTHSHGRYFPSGCQISRRPRLWLCVMMALKLSHLFILNVWPAINEAQSEEKKSRATIYHTPPRPRRKHAHIQTRRALEMRCACISLNFL